jgi:hypothetical protein
MKRSIQLLAAGLLLLASCKNKGGSPDEIIGYAPIYQTDSEVEAIKSTDPQPIVLGGKIYTKGHYLYQVENGKGIHVLNIQNASNPVKVSFIQIPGAQELSIKGTMLYANNYNDLVVVNIENNMDVKLVNRVPEVFHIINTTTPPENGYFECIDPARGPVVGWEKKMLYSPKCKY